MFLEFHYILLLVLPFLSVVHKFCGLVSSEVETQGPFLILYKYYSCGLLDDPASYKMC